MNEMYQDVMDEERALIKEISALFTIIDNRIWRGLEPFHSICIGCIALIKYLYVAAVGIGYI